MKEKIKRIAKYTGIGFGGLFVLTIFLAFILPEPDSAPAPIVEQSKEDVIDEVAEITEDVVIEESEPEVVETTPPPVIVETQPQIETPPEPEEPKEEIITDTGEKYYTSSHHTAKYYYPEDCSAWEELSPSYLRSFNSLESLLASYNRSLSPQCN